MENIHDSKILYCLYHKVDLCLIGYVWDSTSNIINLVECVSRSHSPIVLPLLLSPYVTCPPSFQWGKRKLICSVICLGTSTIMPKYHISSLTDLKHARVRNDFSAISSFILLRSSPIIISCVIKESSKWWRAKVLNLLLFELRWL